MRMNCGEFPVCDRCAVSPAEEKMVSIYAYLRLFRDFSERFFFFESV